MSSHLSSAELERDLGLRDLSDPSDGPHAIQQLLDIAVGALTGAWGVPARLCRGPRAVPTADNYDNLNFTPDSASRDSRYTRYVNAAVMLRSHASAMVPPAVRAPRSPVHARWPPDRRPRGWQRVDRGVGVRSCPSKPYQPVSNMPPVTRDLSVAVGAGDDGEQIGDRVRDALGDDALAVEEVAVLSDTPYTQLPASAIQRMGMTEGQRNLLLRVLLRHPERTLTDTEANEIRDRVYDAIHQGSVQEWSR